MYNAIGLEMWHFMGSFFMAKHGRNDNIHTCSFMKARIIQRYIYKAQKFWTLAFVESDYFLPTCTRINMFQSMIYYSNPYLHVHVITKVHACTAKCWGLDSLNRAKKNPHLHVCLLFPTLYYIYMFKWNLHVPCREGWASLEDAVEYATAKLVHVPSVGKHT